MNKHLLTRLQIEGMDATVTRHQFNDNAVRHSRALASTTGMQRIGIHVVTVEPGHDTTTHHYHDADEEFIYILAGHGTARIGDEEFAVGPGDFMGFPAPSPAHSMRNTSDQDLVYLMGGEKWPVDIVHYPDLRRSMHKRHGERAYFDWDDEQQLPPRP